MQESVEKIAFVVSLINGDIKTHTYDLPSTKAEINALMKEKVTDIVRAMWRGKSAILYFDNPITIYNPDNVLSVSIEGITTSDIEKAIKSAHKKIGLVK